MSGQPRPVWKRLIAKVDFNGDRGCWIFGGSLSTKGYGKIAVSHRDIRGAHRVMFEHYYGPIPSGLHLDHICRVRSCVNPEHLEPVTPAENNRRGASFSGRPDGPRTHCPHGHELTPENTVFAPHRKCRTCRNTQQNERQRSRRADAQAQKRDAPGQTGRLAKEGSR